MIGSFVISRRYIEEVVGRTLKLGDTFSYLGHTWFVERVDAPDNLWAHQVEAVQDFEELEAESIEIIPDDDGYTLKAVIKGKPCSDD